MNTAPDIVQESAARPQRKRALWKRLLIVSAVMILPLTALELALRWFAPQNVWIDEQGTAVEAHEPWVLTPNGVWRMGSPELPTRTIRTNSDGIVDEVEHTVAKPPGTVRILMLGDSFVEGWGLPYEQTAVRIIERSLHERLGAARVEVIKAGISGFDTFDALNAYEVKWSAYQADVVLLTLVLNDLITNPPYDARLTLGQRIEMMRTRHGRFDQSFLQSAAGSLHILALTQRLLLTNDTLYERMYFALSPGNEYLRSSLQPAVEKRYDDAVNWLLRLNERCRADGAEFHLVVYPQRIQVLLTQKPLAGFDPHVAPRYLGEKLRAAGAGVLDLLPALSVYSPHMLYFTMVGGHPTAAGASVASRELLVYLLTQAQPLRQLCAERAAGAPSPTTP